MEVPSLEEWLDLPEAERIRRAGALNPYAGEGVDLIRQVADRFRVEFGHLRGLEITGPGLYHGGSWVIGASHPLIFDRRRLPEYYLGVDVRASVRPPLPPEFQGQEYPHGYIWSPPNYERFVDRCADEIRERLAQPDMTRDEMLSALVGRPFGQHVAQCRQSVKEGKIPPFE
jgi:hypothetical protein